jgi:elongation factor 3
MVSHEDWSGLVVPYLKQLFGDDASGESPEYTVCTSFRSAALGDVADDQFGSEGDDASLCNIEFSLAFGGKILLHKTYLRLGRGRRYGVLGKNGAGKTTLLTNIGSGNIEGLPTHLRTIYVQHDNATDDYGVPVIDELLLSKELVAAKVSRANAELELKGIGFTDDMLEGPRSALSGGWKMKLLLIKAVLSKADVLLLDEVSLTRSLVQ